MKVSDELEDALLWTTKNMLCMKYVCLGALQNPRLPGTAEVEMLCWLDCFDLLGDPCEDNMPCYGSPATVLIFPLEKPFGESL